MHTVVHLCKSDCTYITADMVSSQQEGSLSSQNIFADDASEAAAVPTFNDRLSDDEGFVCSQKHTPCKSTGGPVPDALKSKYICYSHVNQESWI